MMRAEGEPERLVNRDTLAAFAAGWLDRARAVPDDAVIDRRFVACGLAVRARFTDPALAQLYVSRLNIQTGGAAPQQPDLHVDVFSCNRLGQQVAIWRDGGFTLRDFDSALETVDAQGIVPCHHAFWQLYRRGQRYGVQIQATEDERPPWDAGAPLRLHFHWALAARGRRLLHAAALGQGGVGFMMIGAGGAGKSSTTMAGAAAGLQTVGDDYIVVDQDPPAAHRLFRIAKLDRASIARLGAAAAPIRDHAENWQNKVEFEIDQLFAGASTDRIALRALVFPRIAQAATTTLVPMPVPEAMRLLTFANLPQIPTDMESGMRFFAALVRRLPAYRLNLSSEPAEIGATLRRFAAGLGRAE